MKHTRLVGHLQVSCVAASLLVLISTGTRLSAEEERKPIEMTVAPQSNFHITVRDNPSTGYTLGLVSMSKGIVLLRSDPPPRTRGPRPGASRPITFHFYTTQKKDDQPGTIVFARFRQWDVEKTYREEVYRIQVGNPPPLSTMPPKTLDIKPAVLDNGVGVWAVKPNSVAEKLGLRPGDFLVSINGESIRKVSDIDTALEKTTDRIRILVTRPARVELHLELSWTP